jgi:hypothetical protein
MEFKNGYPTPSSYNIIVIGHRIYSIYTNPNYRIILKLTRLCTRTVNKYSPYGLDIPLGSDLENIIKVLNESN